MNWAAAAIILGADAIWAILIYVSVLIRLERKRNA